MSSADQIATYLQECGQALVQLEAQRILLLRLVQRQNGEWGLEFQDDGFARVVVRHVELW